MRKPQVGDIWLRKGFYRTQKSHYLVLDDRVEMGMAGGIGYRFLILETGEKDSAYIEHFNTFCEFIQ